MIGPGTRVFTRISRSASTDAPVFRKGETVAKRAVLGCCSGMDNFRIPPAAIALGAAIVQLSFGRKAKGTLLSRGAALSLASASTLMGASAVAKFRAETTTVDPMNVSAAATVVQSGPFRLTRNPMYVGPAGMLFAHALWRKSLLAVVPAMMYIAMIDRFQIPAEEAVLKEKFGATYEDYARRVPRWVLR